jgi:hypothetical protein
MKSLDAIRGRPRFRIVGVIVHGVGHWVFVVPPTVRGGASQTCTILHMVLEEAFRILDKAKMKRPAHLWIQADNCGGDNKNHVVLGFCAMLVGRGAFKTVQLNHLMVGHTHEDIDAFFAILSRILKGTIKLLTITVTRNNSNNLYYVSLPGTEHFGTVEKMVRILVDAYGNAGDVESDEGRRKKGSEKVSRLYGKVHIKVLMSVFDWMSLIYGTKSDTDDAENPKTINQAIKANNITRVDGMNSLRSFELTMGDGDNGKMVCARR